MKFRTPAESFERLARDKILYAPHLKLIPVSASRCALRILGERKERVDKVGVGGRDEGDGGRGNISVVLTSGMKRDVCTTCKGINKSLLSTWK